VEAGRISYAGELGWELTTETRSAVVIWDALRRAGTAVGLEPFGYRALDALRMEKGYRYFGTDLTMLDTPFEAGLGAFVRVERGPFIGRDALVAARDAEPDGPARRLRTLLIGGPEYVAAYGGEAVRVGGEVVGRLRSVAYGPTVERTIGYAYLPADVGEGAAIEVDIFDSRVEATVAPDVLVDPAGDRMRG
jgi:4-methylaminobutanoate oxidase (formaldehyde-forming)